MVDDEKEKSAFERVAKMAGGEALVSEDENDLNQLFTQLNKQIINEQSQEERKTFLKMVFKQKIDGQEKCLSATNLVDLPTLMSMDQASPTDIVTYRFKEMPQTYGEDEANFVYGDDIVFKEVRLDKKIPLKAIAKNRAVEISVDELLTFTRLRGIEAPSYYRFACFKVSLKNILPTQEVVVYPDGSSHPSSWIKQSSADGVIKHMIPPYLIPDLKNHLFLKVNNLGKMPLSEMTYLAEEPLILPNQNGVMIPPEGEVKGMIIFLIKTQNLTQASLHFYDTRYGHIDLPLIGTFTPEKTIAGKLPLNSPKRLSDTFSLNISGVRESDEINQIKTADDATFKILEAQMSSKVQALLDMNPAERFFLKIPTAFGPLFTYLHPITDLLPMGFYRQRMLAPGAPNTLYFAFYLPKLLAQKSAELFVELKGQDVLCPLDERKKNTDKLQQLGNRTFSGDGIDVTINHIGIHSDYSSQLIVDVTLADLKDGQNTSLLDSFYLSEDDPSKPKPKPESIALQKSKFKSKGLGTFSVQTELGATGEKRIWPLSQIEELLFGLTDETVVFDGNKRRAVLIFDNPLNEVKKGELKKYYLESALFPELKIEIKETLFPVSEQYLLTEKFTLERTETDELFDNYRKVLDRLINLRKLKNRKKPGFIEAKQVDITAKETLPPELTPPSLALYGNAQLDELNRLDDFLPALKKLAWKPTAHSPWQHTLSPEALLTQGFGSASDIAHLAATLLSKKGIKIEKLVVPLSQEGKKKLGQMMGQRQRKIKSLPGIRYKENDQTKIIIFPFLESLDKIKVFIKDDKITLLRSDNSKRIQISVYAEVVPKSKDVSGQFRDLSNALTGGASEAKEIYLFSDRYPAALLSKGAVDLAYVKQYTQNGAQIKAVLDGPMGRIIGDDSINTKEYRVVKEGIKISMPDKNLLPYERVLKEDEKLEDAFHTLALNLPDIPKAAVPYLEEQRNKVRASLKTTPDEFSRLKWSTRDLIAKFIASQTKYENELAKSLDVTIGRTKQGRCLIVTILKNQKINRLQTHLDLRRVFNEVDGDTDATIAFNIFSTLFAAFLEEEMLDGGMGVFSLWRQLSPDTPLIWINNRNRYKFIEVLEKQEYPKQIIEHIKETRNIVCFPATPANIDGVPRWGWLEFDPKTYQITSVLDTLEHGSLMETTLTDFLLNSNAFMIGFLGGVTNAIWSTSAYSLIESDYAQILKNAEALSSKIGKILEKGAGTIKSLIDLTAKKGSLSAGGVKVSGGLGAGVGVSTSKVPFYRFNLAGPDKGLTTKGLTTKDAFGSYAKGFQRGVAFYFSRARK
ncbi:hypothetical protein ACFLQ1_02595 [Candidatus Auribacterota bacterium]